jgi:hypothetical protein
MPHVLFNLPSFTWRFLTNCNYEELHHTVFLSLQLFPPSQVSTAIIFKHILPYAILDLLVIWWGHFNNHIRLNWLTTPK